jgi:hypothetical protein
VRQGGENRAGRRVQGDVREFGRSPAIVADEATSHGTV